MPHREKTYAALLFDMDGTLLSSIAAAERVWSTWAQRRGIDVDAFLPTIHGVRAADTIRRQGLTDIDLEAEVAWVERAEIEDVDGVVAIDGVVDFLNALPEDRWAIVTSATVELATARLDAAGIKRPKIWVTAEDVTRGKPAPDCFLLGAERLGVDIKDCLIFEDAPAGIQAAKASGADLLVVTATHAHPQGNGPAIPHYRDLSISVEENGNVRISCSAS
ncbi:sugar-phosphatase [Rhizobium sp. SG_E_25_P2]|uniref:HAD family hydrolase n=1 Tax=Rhizobium sp. SG_E_25_P2 TaxID=2879942 RepID=UPI002474178A|nr:HAD family hydrolase [Rhizobium sp. SG_E_25_P2]MDH6267698.1 sugar-phosphatase [Rhizobium sp. SG_E_25_P2]